MEFARPYALLLLLAVPVAYWAYRRSLVDLSRFQRRVGLVVRTLMLVLLVLALAGVRLVSHSKRLAVVFLLDGSQSVAEESFRAGESFVREAMRARRVGQRVSVVTFAETVEPRVVDATALPEDAFALPMARGETALAKAIEVAWSIVPSDAVGRIVVLSDGRETRGDAVPVAEKGVGHGIEISTRALAPSSDPELLVGSVTTPAQVKQGEPFKVTGMIHSNYACRATVKLFKGAWLVGEIEGVEITPGENAIEFDQTVDTGGTVTFKIVVEHEQDTLVDNNAALSLTVATGKPKVLLVDDHEEEARYLSRALIEEDIDVRVRSGAGVPKRLEELQSYDMLILSDVPAGRMSNEQMENIRTYVRDLGGGLMMLGSENSFGLGGYYKTPVEEVLPVMTDIEKRKESPSLAMCLVIDKSGSMGGVKIELAKEAAKTTVDLLTARDQLGVIAFDGSPFWVSEMHSAGDKMYIVDRIASLSSGGGTNMYPPLQEAFSALSAARAKLKHVIVLTDGHSQPGDFYQIIAAMRQERITCSTVAIGSGADVSLLEKMAEWGGGRFYFTEDPSSIPQIFTKETVTVSKSALKEEPFVPEVSRPSEMLKGIAFDEAPFLLGYVITRAKETSEVFLISDTGDPVLASWRYGLGTSLAFTSDAKNRWAVDWVNWPAFGKFWAQVVRAGMRRSFANDFLTRVDVVRDRARLVVDAVDGGEFVNGLETEVVLIGPGPTDRAELEARQTSPGRYEASFDLVERGAYIAQITQRRDGTVVNRQSIGTVKSYSPEFYLYEEADVPFLRVLAAAGGGSFNPDAGAIFSPPDRAVKVYRAVWPGLLVSALVLFLLDLLLRRVDLQNFRMFRKLS